MVDFIQIKGVNLFIQTESMRKPLKKEVGKLEHWQKDDEHCLKGRWFMPLPYPLNSAFDSIKAKHRFKAYNKS